MNHEDINISPNLRSHIELELEKNKAYLDSDFSKGLYQSSFQGKMWELTLIQLLQQAKANHSEEIKIYTSQEKKRFIESIKAENNIKNTKYLDFFVEIKGKKYFIEAVHNNPKTRLLALCEVISADGWSKNLISEIEKIYHKYTHIKETETRAARVRAKASLERKTYTAQHSNSPKKSNLYAMLNFREAVIHQIV